MKTQQGSLPAGEKKKHWKELRHNVNRNYFWAGLVEDVYPQPTLFNVSDCFRNKQVSILQSENALQLTFGVRGASEKAGGRRSQFSAQRGLSPPLLAWLARAQRAWLSTPASGPQRPH